VIKANASNALRDFAIDYDSGHDDDARHRELPRGTTNSPGVGGHARHRLRQHGRHEHRLLAVGTARFDDRLTGGVDSFAPDADVVHVDIDPAEISKISTRTTRSSATRRPSSGADDAMPGAPDCDEWRDQCQTWKAEYPMEYATPDDEPLKPQFVVEKFSRSDAGRRYRHHGRRPAPDVGQPVLDLPEPRTWMSSHGLGTMGYGVPAAIGAKLAAPDQEVVCFDGDGSFPDDGPGPPVAVRENLNITYVVPNNEAVGMVRQWQDAFYEGRRMASDYPWIPEFDKLAEAFALGPGSTARRPRRRRGRPSRPPRVRRTVGHRRHHRPR